MLRNVYRLVAPRSFCPVETAAPDLAGNVVVRPTHLSICNADQRYYQGARPAQVLAAKLPMALIHEGMGVVVSDKSGEFARGRRVVMLPNNPHERDEYVAENYLPTSDFCGSGYDGFMQELAILPPSRVLPLPDGVKDEVAAFTELVSVAMHAISRFDVISHGRRDAIGVWGDGNVGYIVSLLLKARFPRSRIYVVGRNPSKLADFTFADGTVLAAEAAGALAVDHAFECCGGSGSVEAIEQIIGCIRPEGALSLLGVTEQPVPINTRMVLEKGLKLFGSSRSGRGDFLRTIELYGEHPQIPMYLEALVGDVMGVRNVRDMTAAFEADIKKTMGKTVMLWDV